ncbi:MAG: 2-amino-4-hydroxy-6-hydroxymethyldihydropteridine diphosphokinase [Chloroflexota bacterium]
MTHEIYIALGANIGDRLANLRAAIRSLSPDPSTTGLDKRSTLRSGQRFEVVAVSRVYETPPWGFTDQPAFLNMTLHARTDLGPAESLERLKQIEVELGREQTFRWGPRLIDLDILFYDDLIADTPPLVIPHPRLHERAFVLVPLMDIAPDLVHPLLGKTIRQLLADVDATGIAPFTEQIETTVTSKS